ncbi:VOC family protein [Hyphococcus luteus]|uniref:VOC family protein n=1 Tax=Hyphococcus luteus TaxID=2058213 RepID=A0A2S7K8Z9_9PROT|nr:VOC family protein [Marinicaulis flavus]PQA88958.1 VOC family protein [Marinicaulis flavus]
MSINLYLTFDGDCEEAFEFYRSVLGGEFAVMQRFSDGPPDMAGVAEGEKDRIMHVTLAFAGGVLQGSDTAQGHAGPLVKGNNFSICYSPPSRADADAAFEKLSEGGGVTMPMQETFWGSYFGMATDRFGVQWMINCSLDDGAAAA